MQREKSKSPLSSVVLMFETITKTAKKNVSFRKKVFGGKFSELVEMSIMPGNELGEEVHHWGDEILFVVQGKGLITIEGVTERANRHCAIFVKAGMRHNLRNIGRRDLKLLCVCSPPFTTHNGIHLWGELASEQRKAYAWKQ